jgi:hypothetical protein
MKKAYLAFLLILAFFAVQMLWVNEIVQTISLPPPYMVYFEGKVFLSVMYLFGCVFLLPFLVWIRTVVKKRIPKYADLAFVLFISPVFFYIGWAYVDLWSISYSESGRFLSSEFYEQTWESVKLFFTAFFMNLPVTLIAVKLFDWLYDRSFALSKS